jgi:hypothetical protein
MRRKDSNLIHFFAGTLLITTLITLFAVTIPDDITKTEKGNFSWRDIFLLMPTFRWTFMLVFALGLIALDVYILRKYRINYMFIFGLDPDYKLTHVQLFRLFIMLLTIWMLCFMFQCFIIKIDSFYPKKASGVVALITIFVVLCCLPLHLFYLKTRLELFKTLMHILIAPFGPVKFKDFFLADILTSLTHSFKDFISTIFFFISG